MSAPKSKRKAFAWWGQGVKLLGIALGWTVINTVVVLGMLFVFTWAMTGIGRAPLPLNLMVVALFTLCGWLIAHSQKTVAEGMIGVSLDGWGRIGLVAGGLTGLLHLLSPGRLISEIVWLGWLTPMLLGGMVLAQTWALSRLYRRGWLWLLPMSAAYALAILWFQGVRRMFRGDAEALLAIFCGVVAVLVVYHLLGGVVLALLGHDGLHRTSARKVAHP